MFAYFTFLKDEVSSNPEMLTLLDQIIQRYKDCPIKEFKGLSNVSSIRNKGLMAGIDLKLNVDEGVSYSIGDRIGKKVCENAMKDGVLIRPLGDTIVLMPPISIKPDELKKLTRTVYKSIKEITEKDD